MTEKDKALFVNFIKKSSYLYYNIFGYKIFDFDSVTEERVSKILNHPADDAYFQDIVNNKDSKSIDFLAVLNNTNCPITIKENMLQSRGKEIKKNHGFAFVMYFLAQDVLPKTIDTLVKLFPKEIHGILNGKVFRYNNLKEEDVVITDKNVIALCDAFMKRKALRRSVEQTPFPLLKDKKKTKKYLENPKSDEVVFTAIADNKNLSYEVRDVAYEKGVNPVVLMNFTPNMIKDVYNLAIYTYMEMEINPLTYNTKKYSKQDRLPYENACGFLTSLVRNGKLPESLQIDLFYRLISLRQKNRNHLLESLLIYTTSPLVINSYTLVKNNKDRLSVYLNDNITKEMHDGIIENISKEYKDSKKAMPEYVEDFLKSLSYKGNDDDIRFVYSLNRDNLVHALSNNTRTPTDILNDIISRHVKSGVLDDAAKQDILYASKTKLFREIDCDEKIKSGLVEVFPSYLSVLTEENKIGDVLYSGTRKLMSELDDDTRKKMEQTAFDMSKKCGISEFEHDCYEAFYRIIKNTNTFIDNMKGGNYLAISDATLSSILSDEIRETVQEIANNPILLYTDFIDKNIDRFFGIMDKLNDSATIDYCIKRIKEFYVENGLVSNYKTVKAHEGEER